jgi:5-methylcytosine-specific restriction enzyme A
MPGPNANPPWSREEVILAYDLLKREGTLPETNPAVVGLSELLRTLNLPRASLDKTNRFRSPAGVAMKLHNLDFFDSGRTRGLAGGARMDEQVVEEFQGDAVGLRAVANSVRAEAPNVRAA